MNMILYKSVIEQVKKDLSASDMNIINQSININLIHPF